ncbi:MAG: acetylglutamate kinase [Actinobacteria bacterium]|nr:MAG: acetylglutamate kinase [Actinomycetota bacterium]
MEALPYIKQYYGKTVVVKYGGAAMTDDSLKASITSDIVLMKLVGMNPVIVHGGGPEITKLMERLGKPVKFVDGFRVTDEETMDLVKMVLVGKINKELVSLVNQHGKFAIGVSGDDGGLIQARKKVSEHDLGFVGDVEAIEVNVLNNLIEDGYTPIVASIGVGADGKSYNINADAVAAHIAAAMRADKIIFLTDVQGIYADFEDKSTLIGELSLEEAKQMVDGGQLSEGMLPKIGGCIGALEAGVNRAHILNGTIPHALLLEVYTREGIGTMIRSETGGPSAAGGTASITGEAGA